MAFFSPMAKRNKTYRLCLTDREADPPDMLNFLKLASANLSSFLIQERVSPLLSLGNKKTGPS